MLKFNKRVEFILPEYTNELVALDHQEIIEKLSSAFGGATVTTNKGYWSDNGVLYIDNNINIECFYDSYTQTIGEAAEEVLLYGFTSCEQLALTVKINGQGFILDSVEDIATLKGLL